MSLEQFSQGARLWVEGGQSPMRLLANPYTLMALRCWAGSDGARRQGVPPALRGWLHASQQAMDREQPGWYDRLLAQREHCSCCGQTYRVENLAICTGCSALVCHRCGGNGRAANGNEAHCGSG